MLFCIQFAETLANIFKQLDKGDVIFKKVKKLDILPDMVKEVRSLKDEVKRCKQNFIYPQRRVKQST